MVNIVFLMIFFTETPLARGGGFSVYFACFYI